MPTIDTYRKLAKLLLRWHREGNYSIGEKFRLLERYRHLTDRQALDMPMPLLLAQEIVAVEAGFRSWTELRLRADGPDVPFRSQDPNGAPPALMGAVPILFVRDVTAAAAFYRDRLGFQVDFLHGKPPFYGAVSRDRLCLHLRHVGRPNFSELAGREQALVLATIEVAHLKALSRSFVAATLNSRRSSSSRRGAAPIPTSAIRMGTCFHSWSIGATPHMRRNSPKVPRA